MKIKKFYYHFFFSQFYTILVMIFQQPPKICVHNFLDLFVCLEMHFSHYSETVLSYFAHFLPFQGHSATKRLLSAWKRLFHAMTRDVTAQLWAFNDQILYFLNSCIPFRAMTNNLCHAHQGSDWLNGIAMDQKNLHNKKHGSLHVKIHSSSTSIQLEFENIDL